MDIFSRLFARRPKHHESAYGPVYSAVVARLRAAGLTVGGTAGYPRVEVHSITEQQRLDKDGSVRSLALTIESISNSSVAGAVEMNDRAMEALTGGEDLDVGEGWRVLDVVPDQLQDLPETSDSAKILYRILQGYELFVERTKEDDPEVVEDEATEGNDEENN